MPASRSEMCATRVPRYSFRPHPPHRQFTYDRRNYANPGNGKNVGEMFPIEIKVNLESSAADAVAALGHGEMKKRQLWFADDSTSGELTPLLKAGVIIRLRSGDDSDDVTVKLRPCQQAQLIGRWAGPLTTATLDYRIECDWSVRHRVLAASAVVEHAPGELLELVRSDSNVGRALSADQREFFELCAKHARPLTDSRAVHQHAVSSALGRLQVDNLVALGPIASTKWTEVRFGELDLTMERWTVADLDLVELSLRVKPKAAESAADFAERAARRYDKLLTAVRDNGLVLADVGENKTERIISALIAAGNRQAG